MFIDFLSLGGALLLIPLSHIFIIKSNPFFGRVAGATSK